MCPSGSTKDIWVKVMNLLMPGTSADILRSVIAESDGMIIAVTLVLIGYLCLVAVVMGYSVIQLSNARDIRHLIDLHAAERGIYFGLEDTDPLPSG